MNIGWLRPWQGSVEMIRDTLQHMSNSSVMELPASGECRTLIALLWTVTLH